MIAQYAEIRIQARHAVIAGLNASPSNKKPSILRWTPHKSPHSHFSPNRNAVGFKACSKVNSTAGLVHSPSLTLTPRAHDACLSPFTRSLAGRSLRPQHQRKTPLAYPRFYPASVQRKQSRSGRIRHHHSRSRRAILNWHWGPGSIHNPDFHFPKGRTALSALVQRQVTG